MKHEKTIIACPACEYERNSKGQPVERNGQMQCLDCSSTWRELSTAHETVKNAKPKTRARQLAEQVTFKEPEPELNKNDYAFANKYQSVIPSYRPGFGVGLSVFAACLLFLGLYLGLMFLEHGKTQSAQVFDKLQISDIKIEEQVRRNGQKVFTVKGLVSNPTDGSKSIPRIAIILRKQNGSEITRWYYNSSLASLRSGGKSRFASSIQYDTPIVAYAEAVFK